MNSISYTSDNDNFRSTSIMSETPDKKNSKQIGSKVCSVMAKRRAMQRNSDYNTAQSLLPHYFDKFN